MLSIEWRSSQSQLCQTECLSTKHKYSEQSTQNKVHSTTRYAVIRYTLDWMRVVQTGIVQETPVDLRIHFNIICLVSKLPTGPSSSSLIPRLCVPGTRQRVVGLSLPRNNLPLSLPHFLWKASWLDISSIISCINFVNVIAPCFTVFMSPKLLNYF